MNIGIIGIGRMGWVHATHMLELEREEGTCKLVAAVDTNPERLAAFQAELGYTGQTFTTLEDYIASGLSQTTMVVTPTEHHRGNAMALVRAGHRVLLEKPLTGTLAGDLVCCEELDRDYPNALMLAFQRRYDAALAFARDLMSQGAIGRVFKIYSALEDSGPPPLGYQSDGILPDMSVHNVDEILWLTGALKAGNFPDRAQAVGSVLHNKHVASCKEDFDDATLFMWFGTEILGQVQVTRNHVSGYRIETVIYGDRGQIQVGHFAQNSAEIVVEAFGPRGAAEPIARRIFPGGKGGPGAPEFLERYGPAYKAELTTFLDCCRTNSPFPATHNDGLRAQRIIAAGMSRVHTREDAAEIA